jgi:UDP-2,4-diacetamido-2,4,6-trideoxy-beta-L-altropyranose hydrolase
LQADVNTLIIRADATSDSGIGHVMRCLALAEVWQAKSGKVVFISHCESEALRRRISAEGIDLISLRKSHPDPFDWNFTKGILDKLKTRVLRRKPWLVVDGYHFDAEYQKSIKAAGYKLLWIDDYGHADHYYADLVLNQNISAEPSCYVNRESYTQLLLGPSYALLRREFERWQGWQRETPAMAQKVLVTLGGADPDNVTLKVIQALKQMDVPGLKARIIVGPANPHLEVLEAAVAGDEHLQLVKNAVNMPEFISWADLAICAGGGTFYELAFMQLPSFVIMIAENQKLNVAHLHKLRLCQNISCLHSLEIKEIRNAVRRLIFNDKLRKEMSEKLRRTVDGLGASRIISEILKFGNEHGKQ